MIVFPIRCHVILGWSEILITFGQPQPRRSDLIALSQWFGSHVLQLQLSYIVFLVLRLTSPQEKAKLAISKSRPQRRFVEALWADPCQFSCCASTSENLKRSQGHFGSQRWVIFSSTVGSPVPCCDESLYQLDRSESSSREKSAPESFIVHNGCWWMLMVISYNL